MGKVLDSSQVLLLVMGVIWYIFLMIASWKMFQKAGEDGWKALIPVYNGYILYKISWKANVFWILAVATVLSQILLSRSIAMPLALIGMLLNIAAIVITCIDSFKLSKAFGHGIGFGLGLIFLNPVFMMILGYGKSEYQGPQ